MKLEEYITRWVGLLPAQYEFITTPEKEVLFVGGRGNGKTRSLCIKLIQQASIQGNLCLLVRKNLSHLKISTLRMLLEDDGSLAALLPPTSYVHNKNDRTIKLNNGGTIIYTGCDDPMSIRSINAGDVFVDEATQLDEEEWMELLMRAGRNDMGSGGLYAATNPSNQAHFLYRRFITQNDNTRKLIKASSFENIFLPDTQIKWLNNLSNIEKERYTSAEWVATDKMIYKMWDREKHTKTLEMNKYCDNIVRWCISMDFGYTNPTAILLCGFGKDGTIYVFDSWCKSNKRQSSIIKQVGEYVNIIKELSEEDPVVIVDPSAASLIAECIAQGFTAIKANNKVEMGISRVQDKLANEKMLINNTCDKMIVEFDSYSYDEAGKPVKILDHCMDALRYATSYCAEVIADEYLDAQSQIPLYIG